jgi:peptidoglycan/LPS O-acetylase OafA/YrhL
VLPSGSASAAPQKPWILLPLEPFNLMKYRAEIDGLRAVAVVPVILFHTGLTWFRGGYVGVDVFFVISGYLITGLILSEIEEGEFHLARFYERRARRILPALFFVICACLPFAWLWMLPYQLVAFSKSLTSVAVFSSNIFFWREIGYFGAANEMKPLLHTWSLSVEEQYYLVFPLCLLFLKKFSRRWVGGLLLITTCISLGAAEWGWRRYIGATFYLAPFRAWEILLGALIAYCGSAGKASVRKAWTRSPKAVMEFGGMAGLALIAYAIIFFDENTPDPSIYTLLPTAGTALILLFGTTETLTAKMLSQRCFVGVGLISYSAYLWHQPMFAFARIQNPDGPQSGLMIVLAALTIGIAYVTWRYVELPFRDRARISRRTIFGGAAILSTATLAIGLFGQLDNGFAGRFPETDRYLVSFNPNTQGRYVAKRFDALRLSSFDPTKRKLFIVGDSFAQDFVNSYAENGYLGNASVSTFYISSACGAIISNEDFSSHILPSEANSCKRQGRFESPEVQIRVRNADAVILAASWQNWQAQYVNETITALRSMGAKNVIVIGRKNFGNIAPLRYLGMSDQAKKQVRNPVNAIHRMTNEYMRVHLPREAFVDFQATVCRDDWTSPVFTEETKLVSFDGEHFTPEGARWVGQRLFLHPLLAPLR